MKYLVLLAVIISFFIITASAQGQDISANNLYFTSDYSRVGWSHGGVVGNDWTGTRLTLFTTRSISLQTGVTGNFPDYPKTRLFINEAGMVGIGTPKPLARLDVHDKNVRVYTSEESSTAWSKDGLTVFANPDGNYSALKVFSSHDAVPDRALLQVKRVYEQGEDNVLYARMDGKVGVGTTNLNGDYRLFVIKGIRTEKVQVDVAGANAWADYVFEPTYPLKSLAQVEQFIKANKHLPEVPSAAEVVQQGINLGQMDATLLKKIEELTLYVIEQNKKLEALSAENAQQNQQLESLRNK